MKIFSKSYFHIQNIAKQFNKSVQEQKTIRELYQDFYKGVDTKDCPSHFKTTHYYIEIGQNDLEKLTDHQKDWLYNMMAEQMVWLA